MTRYYGIELSPNKTETAEGFLICRNVPIARTGSQQYLASEIGAEGDPDAIINVYRDEAEVFSEATLASFEGKPVTNLHPDEMVTPESFTGVACGHVQNVRRYGDNVVADLYISDAQLIADVQNKVKKEVSCGYTCDYVNDGDTWKQVNIRGNHVAVVPLGRAGHEVAIKDSAIKAAEERSSKGNMKSKFLTALLSAFGHAAKDAEPEEIEKMVEAAAATISAAQEGEPVATQEPAPEAKDEPGTEPEAKPAGDECGEGEMAEMLKAVLEKLAALEAKLNATDEEPEKAPEEKIDEAINELEKAEKPEGDEEADPEAAVTVKAEEMAGDECGKDAANFLRAIRPIIAGISNPDDKKKAADAALKQIKNGQQNYAAIFAAAKDSAKVAANESGKTTFAKKCEDQQNAYNAFNPHKH